MDTPYQKKNTLIRWEINKHLVFHFWRVLFSLYAISFCTSTERTCTPGVSAYKHGSYTTLPHSGCHREQLWDRDGNPNKGGWILSDGKGARDVPRHAGADATNDGRRLEGTLWKWWNCNEVSFACSSFLQIYISQAEIWKEEGSDWGAEAREEKQDSGVQLWPAYQLYQPKWG